MSIMKLSKDKESNKIMGMTRKQLSPFRQHDVTLLSICYCG